MENKKVWYIVESNKNINTSTADFNSIADTIEEAYSDEISSKGIDGKKYIFKIELLGEIHQILEIKYYENI